VTTTRQRLQNVILGALGGAAGGVIGQLVLRHDPMGVWVFVSAVAAGGLSGLFGPIRREPGMYWSGLLEWCFAPSHAVYPRNRCAAQSVDQSPVMYASHETIVVRWQLP
jgi:hypothetical protein